MTFGPLPAPLLNAIQQNYLALGFLNPLLNKLAYREISEKISFPARIGESQTFTKTGLMIPNMIPLAPNSNTNIDNGLTPQQYGTEQYTLSVAQYPQVPPIINILNDRQGIASVAIRNAINTGMALATLTDRLARYSLFNSYMSGNTFITTAASSTTQHVDDTRGFETVVVNGKPVAVGMGNPLSVRVNGVLNTVVGFAKDLVNTSTTAQTGGTSGNILLGSSVSSSAGWAVISSFAPLIVRPSARATSAALQSGDLLTMQVIRTAIAALVNNGVQPIRGAYNMYLNQSSMNQLQQDPEFQLVQRGTSVRDPVYKDAWIYSTFLRCRFIDTTETYIQDPGAVDGSVTVAQGVQRPVICGEGALVEGVFTAGIDAIKDMNNEMGIGSISSTAPMELVALSGSEYSNLGYYYHIRPPIDALGQIITQAGNYVGGFTVPTDVTTVPEIIPTASRAYFKRAVVIETAA
jgi:hypothetical protein